MQVANGTADVTTYFVLRDSTAHAPKTDVTVTDIDLYYCEQGAAMAAKVDATALAAADSAHGDNQAFHVGQGLYRIDWPDTCFNGGVGKVVNLIVVCTGVDTTFLEVELTGVAQTGDSYAVVAHADYGNAKLVRSTTPANTLTVDASHRALSDLASILGTALTETAGQIAAAFKKLFDVATPVLVASDAMRGTDGAYTGTPPSAADVVTAMEANGSKLDHLWEMTEDDGGMRRYTANALEEGPVGTGTSTLTAQDVRDAMKLAPSAGAPIDGSVDDLLGDIPTVTEFEARSLPSADYVVVGDTLAAVTTVGSVTGAVGSIAAGGITATSFAAGAIDATAIKDGAIDAATFAAGAIDAAAIATGAIDADSLAADAGAELADAVWDEAIAGHAVAGSTGAALSAAGSAGDPWLTALPGAYVAGSAGDIIGNLVTDIGALTPAVAISATTAASVATGALAVRTHHSLSQAISSTYAGNLNAATKLWLAVKAEKDDTDAQAVVFIEKTGGLTVLAGAAYTTVAHGSLTVGGIAGAWTVTVALDEVATGLLTAYADGMLWAECKALVAGSTVAVWDGVCDVARGIVQTVV